MARDGMFERGLSLLVGLGAAVALTLRSDWLAEGSALSFRAGLAALLVGAACSLVHAIGLKPAAAALRRLCGPPVPWVLAAAGLAVLLLHG